MGIKHTFVSSKSDGADTTKVKPSEWNDDHEIDGDVDFDGHAVTNIEDEAYNQTAWNGNLSAPTKNAIRDKIEALVLSGGGVTDFLALDDTPDAYAATSGESGRVLSVNLAETAVQFSYSTGEYADIRDYGTVVDSGDITAALQATIDALATHRKIIIRIPKIATALSFFTLDAAAISWGSAPWIIELEVGVLKLSSTWDIGGNHTVRGIVNRAGSTAIGHSFPEPAPNITTTTGVLSPVLRSLSGSNKLLERLQVNGGGVAFECRQCSLITIRDCSFSSGQASTPLEVVRCFWVTIENVYCEPRAAGDQWAADFFSEIGAGVDCGLIRIREFRCARNGIRLKSASTFCRNFLIEDIISENFVDGANLITFDSTLGSQIGQIKIVRPENADAVGTSYLIKSIGTGVAGVFIERPGSGNLLIDPTSDPITDFVVDLSETGPTAYGFDVDWPLPINTETTDWASWQFKTPTSIDVKLACAPIVGANWSYGTPIVVPQNPASWTATSGSVTTGKRGPDGSTMAGEITGSEIRFYSATHTLAVGDWIIAGVWINGASGGSSHTGGTILSLETATFRINGATFTNLTSAFLETRILDYGWYWACTAVKVTAIGTNPCIVRFKTTGFATDFFAPCACIIPVADAIDDAWAINVARSLRGGWSSGATAGNVSLLDHQLLQCGASGGSVTGGVQANKLLTPRAGALTIATGAITVTGSYHAVDTEASAASDDLDTINGGAAGYRLVLRASNTARTVVCKDGTGNLALTADFSLDNTQDTIELIYDATLATWLELGRSDNGA